MINDIKTRGMRLFISKSSLTSLKICYDEAWINFQSKMTSDQFSNLNTNRLGFSFHQYGNSMVLVLWIIEILLIL